MFFKYCQKLILRLNPPPAGIIIGVRLSRQITVTVVIISSDFPAILRNIVFQIKTNSTSGHDTQLFLASKIRVKGVDGWFERLIRALEVISPCNPDQPIHPNIKQPSDLVDLEQVTLSQTIITTVNGLATNIPVTTISAEECYNLEGELTGLEEFLRSDPVANYHITMEQTSHLKSKKIRKRDVPMTKKVKLTAFISLREGCLPSEFNERQARSLMGIEHPTLNARGKVDACWALDRLSKELGLEWEELVNKIENVARIKRRIKDLKTKLSNATVTIDNGSGELDTDLVR